MPQWASPLQAARMQVQLRRAPIGRLAVRRHGVRVGLSETKTPSHCHCGNKLEKMLSKRKLRILIGRNAPASEPGTRRGLPRRLCQWMAGAAASLRLLPECGIWIQILEYSSVAARFKFDDTREVV